MDDAGFREQLANAPRSYKLRVGDTLVKVAGETPLHVACEYGAWTMTLSWDLLPVSTL